MIHVSALPRGSGVPGFFWQPRRHSIKHLGPRFRGEERVVAAFD